MLLIVCRLFYTDGITYSVPIRAEETIVSWKQWHTLSKRLKGVMTLEEHLTGRLRIIVNKCITKLSNGASTYLLASKYGKHYYTFSSNERLSRPYLPSLYINNANEFSREWDEVISAIDATQNRINCEIQKINRVLYSSITSFSCCYDLWKHKSRKTPGTFF